VSRRRIASIASNDALILPHGANLPRMRFSGMTGRFEIAWSAVQLIEQ
jgi:hypothetical protein